MARSKNTNTNDGKREPVAPSFIAYHVADKGEDKSYWTRIGAAFAHKDGEGFTLDLELVPVQGGRIVLRLPKEVAPEEGA